MMIVSMSRDHLLERLEPPTGPLSMVLDTDTYNEIDDQFAVTYGLLSDRLEIEAIYAAPFSNQRSAGPADGMYKSYEEILRLLERLGRSQEGFVYLGSERYLGRRDTPVESDAAQDLIERALRPRREPLYVVAIGAITNVASALLLEPRIGQHIVIVWLGGHPQYWLHTREFNLAQDVLSAQVVFDSGAPVVQIPCKNVAEHLRTTVPEMEAYIKGRGAIGDYLYQIFCDYHTDHYAWSKVIWDISTIAFLNNPDWVPTDVRPSPVLCDDATWGPEDGSRHPFRVAVHVNRDHVFGDLLRKLSDRSPG
jgi:inosine-uridine nucleoside N-ribohydrolase